MLYQTSCLVPVSKRAHPSSPDDYIPVVLTSHIMKALEKLLLVNLNKQTEDAEGKFGESVLHFFFSCLSL